MRILFVSIDLIAADLAYRLQQEGHEVKLCVTTPDERNCFDGIVPKVDDWREEIEWVGKEGLIVFDYTGYGKEQDELRAQGYRVIGGSEHAEKVESERAFGDALFKQSGLRTVPLIDFDDVNAAVEYVRANPSRWVLKHSNNYLYKNLSYFSFKEDGSDMIDFIENSIVLATADERSFTLQRFIEGIEIGVGRYFNGSYWVGPIEYNIEHTKLMTGDRGPTVDEMGTLAWYRSDESEKLYQEVLAPLTDFLKEANFKGDFEVNCIVNEEGAFPLEATARFGSPIIHLHDELHISSWGEFLGALADGVDFDLEYKDGYGIAVLLTTPPFPYYNSDITVTAAGSRIYLDEDITEEQMQQIHLDQVTADDMRDVMHTLRIAGTDGYNIIVTGHGDTPNHAREHAQQVIDKIHMPKMMYRPDIGVAFEEQNEALLRSWGYLS